MKKIELDLMNSHKHNILFLNEELVRVNIMKNTKYFLSGHVESINLKHSLKYYSKIQLVVGND